MNINYYYYLIIMIPIMMFVNKKRASYSDHFELCRSPNCKYTFFFLKIGVNGDINMKFIVFRDVEMNSGISDDV
jgi:hypothetical protein